MIVEYDDVGRITHIISDPVPPHMASFLREKGHRFLDLPPVPWVPEPQFDENGDPLMEQVVDELGKPLFDPTIDEVTGEATSRPVLRQMLASNGVDYAACDILDDYVVGGEIRPRPACPAVVSVSGRTISITAVPPGSMVEVAIEGVSIHLDDDYRIELDEPGPVTVTVTPPWPYLEATYDLEIE